MTSEIRRWAERVRAGEPRALARALTEVENRGAAADALLEALFEGSDQARRIGVTGPPGAGKSTLVDAMLSVWRRRGSRPAVLAVDPSSPFSGGAILGDRVRMARQEDDAGVYIRSMAARGALGGLAPSASDALTVLGAAGFDPLLIETVGVGQSEIDVVLAAALTVLVLTPGAGDDVQALKAGVLEIADVFVVNKADLPGADRLESQLRTMFDGRRSSDGADPPPVLRVVASEPRGVEELIDALDGARARPRGNLEYWRRRLARDWRDRLAARLTAAGADEVERAARAVAAGRLNPYRWIAEATSRAAPAPSER